MRLSSASYPLPNVPICCVAAAISSSLSRPTPSAKSLTVAIITLMRTPRASRDFERPTESSINGTAHPSRTLSCPPLACNRGFIPPLSDYSGRIRRWFVRSYLRAPCSRNHSPLKMFRIGHRTAVCGEQPSGFAISSVPHLPDRPIRMQARFSDPGNWRRTPSGRCADRTFRPGLIPGAKHRNVTVTN